MKGFDHDSPCFAYIGQKNGWSSEKLKARILYGPHFVDSMNLTEQQTSMALSEQPQYWKLYWISWHNAFNFKDLGCKMSNKDSLLTQPFRLFPQKSWWYHYNGGPISRQMRYSYEGWLLLESAMRMYERSSFKNF